MTPQDLLRLHPFFSALSAGDAQELLKRIRCGRVADTAFLDLSRRLAKQPVDLAHDDGSSREAALRVSRAERAARLGVSCERVSMQLAAWSDKGILDQGRGHLVVRGRRALHHVIARA